jgi:ribose transport system substrate-binding protein
MRVSRRRIGALCLLFGVLGLATGLAACGGSSGSGSTESTGAETSAAGGDESAVVAKAKKEIEAHESLAEPNMPKPPSGTYDPGVHKVAIISCGQAAPACAAQSQYTEEAAKAIGWEPSPILDPEFSAGKITAFINQAITEGYEAIVYASANPFTSASATHAAEKAGLAQVAFNSPADPAFPQVPSVLPSTEERGNLVADWIIASSDGEPGTIQIFSDQAYEQVQQQLAGVREVLETCSACEFEETQVTTAELTKPGPPYFTAALAQHPDTSYFVAPYDSAAIPMGKTVADQGLSDIKVTGFDGAPEAIQQISAGKGMSMTVTSPFEYAAWVSVDMAARILAGAKTWDAEQLPNRVVTADDVSQFEEFWKVEDFDFKSMFEKSWGK